MSCVLADDEVMLTIKPGQVCTIDDSVCWKLLGNQCLNMPISQSTTVLAKGDHEVEMFNKIGNALARAVYAPQLRDLSH